MGYARQNGVLTGTPNGVNGKRAHSISPAKNKHSAATHRSAAAKQARTFCAAHVKSSFIARSFSAVSAKASVVGASAALGRGRAQQKGDFFRLSLASTFAPLQRGRQWRSRWHFPIGGTQLDQQKLSLLGRVNGPSVVPLQYVVRCKTYREAVRMAWGLRRVHHMTQQQLAAEAGLRAQLISDYLNPDDKPQRRDLPADRIAAFECVVGNSLVTQWLAARASLTVLEEMQATRAAA
jgi:hypothetical protein